MKLSLEISFHIFIYLFTGHLEVVLYSPPGSIICSSDVSLHTWLTHGGFCGVLVFIATTDRISNNYFFILACYFSMDENFYSCPSGGINKFPSKSSAYFISPSMLFPLCWVWFLSSLVMLNLLVGAPSDLRFPIGLSVDSASISYLQEL